MEKDEDGNWIYVAKANELGCRERRIENRLDNAFQYHSIFDEREAKEYLKKFTSYVKSYDMKNAMLFARYRNYSGGVYIY